MNLKPEFIETVSGALRQVSAVDPGPLEADRLISDLGLDSAALVDLIVMLEEKTKRAIDDRQLANMQTLGDLQNLIDLESGNAG